MVLDFKVNKLIVVVGRQPFLFLKLSAHR